MPDKKLSPAEIERNKETVRGVKAWLTFRNVTQRRLADLLGVSEPTVSKWLRGGTTMTMGQFTQIARLLDLEPHELLVPPDENDKATRYHRIALGIKNLTDQQLDALATIAEGMAGPNDQPKR